MPKNLIKKLILLAHITRTLEPKNSPTEPLDLLSIFCISITNVIYVWEIKIRSTFLVATQLEEYLERKKKILHLAT